MQPAILYTLVYLTQQGRIPVTIDEMLSEFSQRRGYFPKAAVEAAIEQQEAITPWLLASLEKAADTGTEDEANDNLTMFALYLLAQFRETRAYSLIINIITRPADAIEYLLGDITTEDLNRVLASVFDGDIVLLQSVIENSNVYEYVRGAALQALTILYRTGKLDRDTVLNYFTDLYRGKLERDENHIWCVLAAKTGHLGFSELADDARQAMEEWLVDGFYYGISDLEADLQKHDNRSLNTNKNSLINDTVAELQHWSTFEPEPEQRPEPKPRSQERLIHTGTLIRETPKTGRNDPCPCGSDKKFKKCCGR
ncbi:DUF1186 domain-containing protein [Endozoicomonas sp.]|uniref:DUF1186 domain-containing protein n=1 Tax=Endozoicomonas sp. TaxID=1892382 RepID=UPI002887C8CC|nr:DUF1186 domain-containing protein [Endozoicomonas sp.]